MPHRTFFWFILPSALAMLIFIALPIVSVIVQSLHIEHPRVMTEVENCGPFSCTKELRVDTEATAKLREEEPLGKFNALNTYTNRNHLALKVSILPKRPGGAIRTTLQYLILMGSGSNRWCIRLFQAIQFFFKDRPPRFYPCLYFVKQIVEGKGRKALA